MTTFMTPATIEPEPTPGFMQQLSEAPHRFRWFLAVVILPCLLMGGYLYLFAADQFQSESHFIVRAQSGQSSSPSGLGALLGMGATGGAQSESNAVADYLLSQDVVDALAKNKALVARFRRPEADRFSRLPKENPTPEELLQFFKKQVDVEYSTDTGITTLRTRAFRPTDAYILDRTLLALGEERVNTMNERSYDDALTQSKRQLAEAEAALSDIQARVTSFRQSSRDVNPSGSADAQVGLISKLNGDLSAAQAQLSNTARSIGTRSPQYAALQQQVRSLAGQVAAQSSGHTATGSTVAVGLGNFERLQMQQQFYAKRYDAASAAFEAARQQAIRQQLYIIRVVDPNLPRKSLYPKRATILLTLFLALLVMYGIGWLIAAGVREHAA